MLNKEYLIPNRKNLSELTKKIYSLRKDKLKEQLNAVEHVNLTTDCWTSKQNFSYISLTAHYLDQNLNMKSCFLSIRHLIGGHSSENLASFLKQIIEEYEIFSKIRFCVTDNAFNIIKALDIIKIKGIRCIGHILHLVVTSALQSIKKILNKEEIRFNIS